MPTFVATGVQPHQHHDGEDNIEKQDREDHEEKEIHGKKEEKVNSLVIITLEKYKVRYINLYVEQTLDLRE